MLNKALLLLLISSSVLLCSCATTDNNDKRTTPFVYDYDETFALPTSRQIRITSEDAKVTVSGSDRSDVRIRAHYGIKSTPEMLQNFSYRLNVSTVESGLHVQEMRQTGSRFIYDKQAHTLHVEVPRNAHVSIVEEDGSCEITAVAGTVDVRMDDGSGHAADCSGPITVTLDDGTFTHRNCTGLVKVQHR